MSKTQKWWEQDGWKALNNKLINYVGLGIGSIPISNLEFVPRWADLKELAALISNDGCKAKFLPTEYEIILTVR